MGDGYWFRRGRRRTTGGKTSRRGDAARGSRANSFRRTMSLEHLEDRRLLTTFLVTNAGDKDVDDNTVFGTLRWAVEQANSDDAQDEIVFADSVFGGGGFGSTILIDGQLDIEQPLRILGPGPRKLAISQIAPNQRLFETNIDADDEIRFVEISGVTLSGGNLIGNDSRGGAIYNRESLLMVETIIENNSAAKGGGVFIEFGGLQLNRSLVQNNTAGIGGGIMNGIDEDENTPSSTIANSTITGNSAVGIPGEDGYAPYGGGVFNRNGRLTITSSTVVANRAIGGLGAGVASWGNEPPDAMSMEPPPAETVFTFLRSSIFYHNLQNASDPMMPVYDDISVVGVTDDDPPLPLLPSVFSNERDLLTGRWVPGTLGYNIVHTLSLLSQVTLNPAPSTPTRPADQPLGTDPKFISDAFTLEPLLADYGGSTDAFMIDVGSPAIDKGAAPAFPFGNYEQRGYHYSRVFNYTGLPDPVADVGSVERQSVSFQVDELYDESETEGQTAGVFEITDINQGFITILGYETQGDFTLREAIAFARKNTDPSVITFSPALRDREFENDPNAQVSAATIALTLGQLTLSTDTTIIGPTEFILELDVGTTDPTPGDGLGSRVLQITGASTDVEISNLTFKGGDINDPSGGAGILLSSGSLLLVDSTVKDNRSKGDGGGIAVRGGTLELHNSTLKNNFATTNGGGFYAGAGTVIVSNSTFSGNSANGRGAGIANANANLTIQFSTITLNTAGTTRGSGVYTLNGAAASTKIRGSIVSQNAINDVEYATGANAKVVSQGYNLVGTGNAIGAFTVANNDKPGITDPMLEPLLITGGQTETHRPKTGSPIIDQGDPGFTPNAFVTPLYNTPINFDQRGPDFVRVFDGDAVVGARIDIGAYELQSSEFIVSTAQDGDDGNYNFGFLSLREAIKLANGNPLRDKITFDPTLPTSLSLNAGSLSINQPATMQITTPMTIEGPGSLDLSLDGSGLIHSLYPLAGPQRIFNVDDGNAATTIDVTITGIGLFNSISSVGGGAILSRENLTLEDLQFVNNHTVTFNPLNPGVLTPNMHGGAIFQQGASLILRNSALTGNYTDGPGADGGAIYAVNANLNFFYTTISGNSTLQGSSRGGGLALKNSTLVASEMTIVGNTTSAGLSDGGGAFFDSSTVAFEESAFGGNTTTGSNSDGGGLYVTGASSQVTLDKNTTVTFNSVAGTNATGGGAYVNGGVLTINNSVVLENDTFGAGGHGAGAAAGTGGTLLITGSQVRLNTAAGLNANGGGVANLSGNVTIRNSTVSENRTTNGQSRGGGVYSDTNLAGTQTTTILNSTISGNSTGQRGGGVFNADGATAIRHSTITNNSTPYLNAGNGVASFGNAATQTTVESSIIAGNVGSVAGSGSDVDFDAGVFANSFNSQGYNVIGTGNAIGEFIEPGDKTGILNPQLGPLAFNGGLTQTHALLVGSPAINSGKPSFNANAFSPPLTTDQRGTGFARVLGGRIDTGAFESTSTALAADFNSDNQVDGDDYLIWQRFNGLQAGATKSQGDATGDGKVNALDLGIWRSQFGMTSVVAAEIPASTGGGSEEPAVAFASVAAEEPEYDLQSFQVDAAAPPTPASVPVTPRFGTLAGAGTPGSSSPGRPAYRPADRRVAARDAAHSATSGNTNRFGAASVVLASDEGANADDSASPGATDCDLDASAEDSVFALLGEGLL